MDAGRYTVFMRAEASAPEQRAGHTALGREASVMDSPRTSWCLGIRYFTRRSTVTQLVTPEPPTLNVTPTWGTFFVGAAPIGSPRSCL